MNNAEDKTEDEKVCQISWFKKKHLYRYINILMNTTFLKSTPLEKEF